MKLGDWAKANGLTASKVVAVIRKGIDEGLLQEDVASSADAELGDAETQFLVRKFPPAQTTAPQAAVAEALPIEDVQLPPLPLNEYSVQRHNGGNPLKFLALDESEAVAMYVVAARVDKPEKFSFKVEKLRGGLTGKYDVKSGGYILL